MPIKRIDPKNKREVKLEKEIVERVEAIQAAHQQRLKLPEALHRKIAAHAKPPPCNLAHYLQKDFASAVRPEILMDDVQRTGFVHEIRIESDGEELTLIRRRRRQAADGPRASCQSCGWRSRTTRCASSFTPAGGGFWMKIRRKQKWTKGKKPEPIYPLLGQHSSNRWFISAQRRGQPARHPRFDESRRRRSRQRRPRRD